MKFTVCFTGGGTAGHVFPGLAVLESVSDMSAKKGIEPEFFWIGSSDGMERSIIKDAGIKYYGIRSGKLRRYFSLENFTDVFRIFAGIIQSFSILLRKRPDIIFSKGGYVSVPPVLAGKILGIPVVTHESDYSPGLATRINKRFSRLVILSFDATKKFFAEKERQKLYTAGNPVRKIFYSADPLRGREILGIKDNLPVLMVLGGSQGAVEINNLVTSSLPALLEKYYVVHQTGSSNPAETGKIPEKLNERYRHYSFIGNSIADIISAADIVVTRAGAGTIWELSVLGKASLLIPLRGKGTRGDQVLNAGFLKSVGAAEMLDDDTIEPEKFTDTLFSLLSDRKKISAMENSVKLLGTGKPAEKIAEKIFEIAGV